MQDEWPVERRWTLEFKLDHILSLLFLNQRKMLRESLFVGGFLVVGIQFRISPSAKWFGHLLDRSE
jgi:hypothetical protein